MNTPFEPRKAVVINVGKTYNTYPGMHEALGGGTSMYIAQSIPASGDEGVVLNMLPNSDLSHGILCLFQRDSDKQEFIIHEDGLKITEPSLSKSEEVALAYKALGPNPNWQPIRKGSVHVVVRCINPVNDVEANVGDYHTGGSNYNTNVNTRVCTRIEYEDYVAEHVEPVQEDVQLAESKSATTLLQDCMNIQLERGKQYDGSQGQERSFKRVATAFNAITHRDLKGSDVALMLQILKDVRLYTNQDSLHEDSVLDKVSYASLHGEEMYAEAYEL